MRVLLDSGIWWRRYHGLAVSPALERYLRNATEWWLSPLSVAEMLYKWRHRPHLLPAPPPGQWLAHSLQGFQSAPLTFEAAQLAGTWDWTHGDPVDRCLAAIAKIEGLTLVHSDTRLKELPGFPQRYFPSVEQRT